MSLLMRMIQEPFFSGKQILVIDRSQKKDNDRTWCFWEKEAGIFESIVTHQWDKINFFSDDFSSTQDIYPYTYKMIRGIDLYSYVKEAAAKCSNIEWWQGDVVNVTNAGGKATVELASEIFTGDYLFNSILFEKDQNISTRARYYLLQHFMGWMIETGSETFDPGVATFMDFRINQDKGTNFMYTLPVSKTCALVEYTLFTKEVISADEYGNALRSYIKEVLKTEDYRIIHTEYGEIPMTNFQFPLQNGKIIYIGTAGGQVKGSSGYAFSFIQKRTKNIINSLLKGNRNFDQHSFNDKKFHLYDSVLLNVLHHNKMKGSEIFANIFRKNPPARIFQFLDNETNILDDLQIMRSVPTGIFLPAAIHELFN